MTRSQAAISHYILENSEEVPFLSSARLANKVHVSEATVTRFCLTLGYSGYSAFQKDTQRWIQTRIAPSERLERTNNRGKESLLSKVFHRDIQNLEETLDNLNLSEFKEAVKLLRQARRVFIIGMRSAFVLAYLTYYQLSRILPHVILLDNAYGLLYDQIVDTGPKDILLAISFPRYAKETLEAAGYFKQRGSRVFAVTDNVLSPLAIISDLTIPVKISSHAFFTSFTSAVSAINCLCAAVSLANPKGAIRALRELETNLPQSKIWLLSPSQKEDAGFKK